MMAKDIGHVLSMIFMPSTARDFLACLGNQRIIDNEEEDRLGFDVQDLKELAQSGLDHFFHGPDILPQEPRETAEGSVKKGPREGLDHRRGVDFFTQLDKAHDEGREDFERRS